MRKEFKKYMVKRERSLLTFFFLFILFIFFSVQAFSNSISSGVITGQVEEKVTELRELIVKPKRQKYKKKGNPAYELYQEIREKAPLYDPKRSHREEDSAIYSYSFYEKILLGLNDMKVDPSSRNLGFLADYASIAYNTGKPVILLSIREKGGRESWDDGKKSTNIISRSSAGVDESFNQENLNKLLEDVLRPIDIFEGDITLMQQRFVSPLSRIAGDFYHFAINDTVLFPGDSRHYIELTFSPVNPETFSFNGRLFVADDSTRFIKKITMRVPQAINLNYVKNIFVTQEYDQDARGNRHQTLDDMALELQIVAGTPSFYGRRVIARSDFSYSPDDIPDIEIQEAYSENSRLLAPSLRLVPLSQAEERLAGIHEAMRKMPLLYWAEQIIMIVAKGYIATSGNWDAGPGARNLKPFSFRNPHVNGNVSESEASRFDFGPVNTLISYNSLEGVRLRIGGMTTGALSPHFFARGYAAWGFRDNKWKYQLEGEYSFRPKKLHAREFPIHSLRITHKYDVDMLGQHYLFTNADNIFLSLKRKQSNLDTYQRLSMLEYTLELENNFSVVAGLRHQIQFATPWVRFVNGSGTAFPHFSQSSFFIKLRYAPGEVFYEGRTIRQPINMDAPVIQLTHEYGPKGFLGSAFTMNVTELSIQKRIWFSSFGFADIILKGGKVWSKVQYPALLWPNANLSYTIQPESYSLMNPMEFANDWYGSLDLTYWLNGLILNRIPLVKNAKLREVVTFKLLSGGLSRKNNPEYDASLFRFPSEALVGCGESGYNEGMATHILGKTPYMELGVGIDNILTILRVDYVWRLTYRDLSGISRSGLRVSLHFSF